MLEATIVLQIIIGKYIEALMIGALLIFNVALSVLQENRAASCPRAAGAAAVAQSKGQAR